MNTGLTPFALTFMLVSMGSVTLLTVVCFVRILRGGELEHGGDTGGSGAADPND